MARQSGAKPDLRDGLAGAPRKQNAISIPAPTQEGAGDVQKISMESIY
jgi:hypothetical protein